VISKIPNDDDASFFFEVVQMETNNEGVQQCLKCKENNSGNEANNFSVLYIIANTPTTQQRQPAVRVRQSIHPDQAPSRRDFRLRLRYCNTVSCLLPIPTKGSAAAAAATGLAAAAALE
jgi:hypothetical protein